VNRLFTIPLFKEVYNIGQISISSATDNHVTGTS